MVGAIFGVAVLWSGWGLGVELLHAFLDPPAPLQAPPSHWTLRAPAAQELESFLELVNRDLPAGRLIAVGDRGLSPSEDFFLSLWVAYHLPRHDVVRAYHRWPLARADHLFLYRSSLEDFPQRAVESRFRRRPVLLREGPAGSIYRIPRPRDSP